MSKHTAGPWKGYTDRGVYVGDDQSRPVFETGCGCCTDATLTQADADLIAAAPDLLEALKLCMDAMFPGSPDADWETAYEKAKAAIAKAEAANG